MLTEIINASTLSFIMVLVGLLCGFFLLKVQGE